MRTLAHPQTLMPCGRRVTYRTFVRHSSSMVRAPALSPYITSLSPLMYVHAFCDIHVHQRTGTAAVLLSGVSVRPPAKYDRRNLCDCARCRPCFVFRHPTGHIRNIFLQPFTDYVWWCILICGILTIIASAHISTAEQQIDGHPSSAGELPHCWC